MRKHTEQVNEICARFEKFKSIYQNGQSLFHDDDAKIQWCRANGFENVRSLSDMRAVYGKLFPLLVCFYFESYEATFIGVTIDDSAILLIHRSVIMACNKSNFSPDNLDKDVVRKYHRAHISKQLVNLGTDKKPEMLMEFILTKEFLKTCFDSWETILKSLIVSRFIVEDENDFDSDCDNPLIDITPHIKAL